MSPSVTQRLQLTSLLSLWLSPSELTRQSLSPTDSLCIQMHPVFLWPSPTCQRMILHTMFDILSNQSRVRRTHFLARHTQHRKLLPQVPPQLFASVLSFSLSGFFSSMFDISYLLLCLLYKLISSFSFS